MKTLARDFNRIALDNPLWSSYTCFAKAIMDKKYDRATIENQFKVLVDKEDYKKGDKDALLAYLYDLTISSQKNTTK